MTGQRMAKYVFGSLVLLLFPMQTGLELHAGFLIRSLQTFWVNPCAADKVSRCLKCPNCRQGQAGLRRRLVVFRRLCCLAVILPGATSGSSCRVAFGGSIRTFFA